MLETLENVGYEADRERGRERGAEYDAAAAVASAREAGARDINDAAVERLEGSADDEEAADDEAAAADRRLNIVESEREGKAAVR